eukprot:m.123138 g.123138  ORF g.123138 m.123138 type:complete len:1436 (+) comp37812_c0_seq42:125-4432(+)
MNLKADLAEETAPSGREQSTGWLEWANTVLRQNKKTLQINVVGDLSDGRVLPAVVECLSRTKLPAIFKEPFTRAQRLQNVGTVLMFIRDRGANLHGVVAKDIVDGDSTAIHSLCESLIRLKDVSEKVNKQKSGIPIPMSHPRQFSKPPKPPPVPVRKSSLGLPEELPETTRTQNPSRVAKVHRSPSFVASAKEAFETMAITRSTSTEQLRSLIRSGRRRSSSSADEREKGAAGKSKTKPVPPPRPAGIPKKVVEEKASKSVVTVKIDMAKKPAGKADKNVERVTSVGTDDENLPVSKPEVPCRLSDRGVKPPSIKRKTKPTHSGDERSKLPCRPGRQVISSPRGIRRSHKGTATPGGSGGDAKALSLLSLESHSARSSASIDGVSSASIWSRSSSIVTVVSMEKSNDDDDDDEEDETVPPPVVVRKAVDTSTPPPQSEDDEGERPERDVAVVAAVPVVMKSSSGVSTGSFLDQVEMFSSVRQTVDDLLRRCHDDDIFETDLSMCPEKPDDERQSSPPSPDPSRSVGKTVETAEPATLDLMDAILSEINDGERGSLFRDRPGRSSLKSPPVSIPIHSANAIANTPLSSQDVFCLESSLSSLSVFSGEETASVGSEEAGHLPADWQILSDAVKVSTPRRSGSFGPSHSAPPRRRHPSLPGNYKYKEATTDSSIPENEIGTTSRRCQTPAEANLVIRRLRRELESARTVAFSVSDDLKSGKDQIALYEAKMSHMHRQIESLLSCSAVKDNEIAGLRKTLEALREEADDRADPSSNATSPELAVPSSHGRRSSVSTGSPPWNKLPPPYPDGRAVNGEGGDIRVGEVAAGKSPKRKRKKGFFRKKKPSTGSLVSVDSMKNGRDAEDKAFNGVAQLEGQLMDSQAEVARLAMSNESAMHETETLRNTVRNLEGQLSLLMSEQSISKRKTSTRSGSVSPIFPTPSPSPLPDFLADDNISDGRKVTVYLHIGDGHRDRQVVAIAILNVPMSMTWEVTDLKIMTLFQRYLNKIDGDAALGLDKNSMSYYWLGDVRRIIGAKCLEPTSPHQATMMDRPAAVVHLRGADEGCCDALAFQTLIPKPFIKSYTSVLFAHHQVLIVGPQLSGKSFLALHLAKYCLQKRGVHVPSNAIVTVPMDSLHEEKTCHVIRDVLAQIYQRKVSASAIILENVASFRQLGDVTACIPPSNGITLFIIATMSMQLHSDTLSVLSSKLWSWRQIQLWWHCDPVYGLLKRCIKRRLVEAHIRTGSFDMQLMDTARWVMRVWYRLNTVLETFCPVGTGLGPGRFLECPLNMMDLELWFVLLWNHTLLPYFTTILRNCMLPRNPAKCEWGDDPIGWILQSCPFKMENSDCPPLLELNSHQLGIQKGVPFFPAKEDVKSAERPSHDHMMKLLSSLVSSPLLPGVPQRQKSSELSFSASEKQREAEEAVRKAGVSQDTVQSLL